MIMLWIQQQGLDEQTPEQLSEQPLEQPSEIEPAQNQQQAQEQPREHDSNTEIQGLNIPPPSVTDRYLVQGTDVSIPFYAFQLVAKDNFEHLFLESHVQHILALPPIFIIQNNRRHPDIVSEVKDDEAISHLQSTITMFSLALAGSAAETKIMKCVAKLMDTLPRLRLADDICEFELCHRFLSRIFSALFDDPDKNVLFRWTSITNQEAKAETEGQGIISKKRPDVMVSELDGVYFDRTLGFVEETTSHSFIQSIDADGLYAMTELLHMLAILNCFNNHWVAEETQPDPTRKWPTLPDGNLDEISSRTKSSKRPSYTLR
ncbi:hypothetical protein BJV82DRAFT_664188 [Fennellomyces sp. T-0311]|nr:hypothetical protein BJV82DRAFT_664188 [Fennellomyces sp. T-0311]